ncbi:hypothetical protein [Limibacterium fermenti]|uniref:hypothetical protein n=1 Tax=Limibacterium fermenti TaxID=3229863 RepID=UPI003A7A49CC
MECLTGYIGFSDESQEGAGSGLYLASLPGLSADLLDGVRKRMQTSSEAFKAVERRSVLKFRTFFVNELNKCWNLSDVAHAECLICGNKPLLSVSLWYLMGAEMMAETAGSERTNRFTTIDLEKAQNLRDEYMDLFFNELHTAVAGIDLSGCVENAAAGGDIQVLYAMP